VEWCDVFVYLKICISTEFLFLFIFVLRTLLFAESVWHKIIRIFANERVKMILNKTVVA